MNKKQPLYNSKIFHTYLAYIKNYYPYIDINLLLKHANIELYQVEDEDYWFTQEQADRFYDAVVNFTRDKEIARKAGRFSFSPDAVGPIRHYTFGMLGPGEVYKHIGWLAKNFTRSAVYESKMLGSNKVEIIVTPLQGVEEKPYQCQNRMGYFEAIPLGFGYSQPKIEHPECIFRGDKRCRYIITWHEKFSQYLIKLKKFAFLFYLGANSLSLLILPLSVGFVIVAITTGLLISFIEYVAYLDRRDLIKSLQNLQFTADTLFSRLEANYNDLLLTMDIAHTLSVKGSVREVLGEMVNLLRDGLDYDRGMILLADDRKEKLMYVAGYGYTDEQKELLKGLSFNLRKPGSKGIFVRTFWEKRPFLVNDIDEIKHDLSAHSVEFAEKVGAKAFICAPILVQGESIGVLAVDNLTSKRPLVQRDLNLISTIARELGIWIENARLREAREKQLLNLIQVLASSIDARDPMTKGHSERVAMYAEEIAKEMGLSDQQRESIKVAGLLHDYGKIAIVDSVLKKKGALSENEYEYVKMHAQKTREILEMVGFDGIFEEVPKIAGAHHERFDGSGYPDGLRGEEIPLGARILAVADVYDALTSPRPYRKAYTPDEALKIICDLKGIHFDPKVVDAFIKCYKKQALSLSRE